MHTCKKRVVSLVLTIVMLLGMMPVSLAANDDVVTMADPEGPITASVEYDSVDRTAATITYHSEGEPAPKVNVVFLLDASWQGGDSFSQFRQMISDAGDDLFEHTRAYMQVITYTQTARLRESSNGPVLTSGWELRSVLGGVAAGDGTANAEAGLKEAAEVVGEINDSENPTVVFWVLGDSFGTSSEDEVKSALDSLKEKLDGPDDALITWQLADSANGLLTDNATQYTPAEGDDKVTAAYACSSEDTFRTEIRESVENLLHDHYRDQTITLSLKDEQSLVTEITSAQWVSENEIPQVTPTVSLDGKSVTVKIGSLCSQVAWDLVLEVELDTDVHKQETVLDGTDSQSLQTGLFDEKSDTGLVFPAVGLDRRQYTITFDVNSGSEGTAPATITAMPGQLVTIPGGDSLTNSGSSFGGWNDKDNNHYTAGQILAMPAKDMTLTPAWGHVEVELELGQVHAAQSNGNQMHPDANASGLLDFTKVTLNGKDVGTQAIHSVQVVAQSLTYSSDAIEGDLRKVRITNPDVNALYARHVGATNQDRVVAYLRACTCSGAGENSGKYDLIIAGPGGVTAPASLDNWMNGTNEPWPQSIESIDLTALDTSQTTDMSLMFSWCQNLTSLNITSLDTSDVTDMHCMFQACKSLTELELGEKFDTSNVTNMSTMFSLGAIEDFGFLEHFDTSKVTNMNAMFYDNNNVVELDLSSFDMSQVTSMSQMFISCDNLTTLTLFDNASGTTPCYKNVTNMGSMFSGCNSLEELDLSCFDTSKVTTMWEMFSNCRSLETLTLGEDFNTSSVTSMGSMFNNCAALTNLDLSKFNTSNVTDMSYMFNNCAALTNLDLSSFNTSEVTSMYSMMGSCPKLKCVNLGEKFNVSNVQSFANMFSRNKSLATICGAFKFGTNNAATSMQNMFCHCEALTKVPSFTFVNAESSDTSSPAENIKFEKLTTTAYMFDSCYLIQSVVNPFLENTNFPALKNMGSMFGSCHALETVNLSGWTLPDLTNTAKMFWGDTNLTSINLSWYGIEAIEGADGEGDYNVSGMFLNVSSTATLNIDTNNNELSTFMTAVVEEFLVEGTGRKVTVNNQEWPPEETTEEIQSVPTQNNGLLPPNDANSVDEHVEDNANSQNPPAEEPTESPVIPSADESADTSEESEGTELPTEGPTEPPAEPEGDEPSAQKPAEPPSDAEDEDTSTNELESEEPPTEVSDESDASSDASQEASSEDNSSTQPASEETSSDEGEEDTPEPLAAPASARSIGPSVSTFQTVEGDNYTKNDDGTIWTHNVATPAGSQFQYLIRVKYVGDPGAQSGEIQVTFPIPEEVRVLDETELTELGEGTELVSISSPQQSEGTTGQYTGGYVVKAPEYDSTTETLTATVAGLFTGYEYEISIWCTNEAQTFPSGDGYVYWDGTAYAQESAASVPSNIYRLWDYQGGTSVPEPPESKEYTVTYQFTGNVPPDAELPPMKSYEENAEVTLADTPTTTYTGYTFKDWSVETAKGTTVSVLNNKFTMPSANVIITGTWELNEESVSKITVKYAYDGDAPAGAPAIGADGPIPESTEIVVGNSYTVVAIGEDVVKYYTFSGWKPTLSVDGSTVNLTTSGNGVYTGDTYSIPDSGTLSTKQFRDKSEVVVTYTGKWTPWTGTIQFDANDGTGSMDPMTNVTHDTTQTLTANAFTREGYTFEGWATSPDGLIVKKDKDSAAGLITEKNRTVTLYAQWRANPITVQVITVTPADIVIYMGGKPYKGTVIDDSGNLVTDSDAGLPEPGFRVQLPDALKGTAVTSLIFKEKNGDRTWEFEPYDGQEGTDVYKLVPKGANQAATRVQFTDPDTGNVITSDEFVVGQEVNKTFEMGLYKGSGATQVGEITVEVNGVSYDVDSSATGTLTVRGTTKNEQYATVGTTFDPAANSGKPGLTAPENTTYTINNSNVHVEDSTGVSLLFDEIINSSGDNRTSQLKKRAENYFSQNSIQASSGNKFAYEFKYLDLVDANNGNAWVKASNDLTVYWPLPEGTSKDTRFTLLHFKDLHREMASDNIGSAINDCDVEKVDITEVTDTHVQFQIGSGGFSPFALVWETDNASTPDPDPNPPSDNDDDDHDTPEDLNTEDHVAYIIGYPDGSVRPQGNITRAEVATIFFRMLTDEARSENWSQTNSYTDVPFDAWYNNAISTLSKMGIISGYPDGSFRPDAPITRAEFTKIAVGFFDHPGNYVAGTYVDVSENAWYADFIDAAVDLGLIAGYPDHTIRPETNITRAEACTVVNRTLGRVPDKDHLLPEDEMLMWPDNGASMWYYEQMQEATNSHDYEWISEGDNQIENWTKKLQERDWHQLEQEWSTANDAPGEEVVS